MVLKNELIWLRVKIYQKTDHLPYNNGLARILPVVLDLESVSRKNFVRRKKRTVIKKIKKLVTDIGGKFSVVKGNSAFIDDIGHTVSNVCYSQNPFLICVVTHYRKGINTVWFVSPFFMRIMDYCRFYMNYSSLMNIINSTIISIIGNLKK